MMKVLVQTEGMYVALYDKASPANRPGVCRDALDSADQSAAGDDSRSLALFNQHWIDRGGAGEMLVWTVSFDGVYVVAIEIVEAGAADSVPDPDPGDSLGRTVSNGYLRCPTGELLLGSLSRIGEADPGSTVRVPRGSYAAIIVSDLEQQSRHEFLEDSSDYPADDGPDWRIYLTPCAPANG